MGLTSPLDNLEQQTRFRTSRIPEWTQPYMQDGNTVARDLMAKSVPTGIVKKWEQSLVAGEIVDSSDLELRGRGLWLLGGQDATILAATLLQRLLLMDNVRSGRFTTEQELLETEAPDGERNERFRLVQLLVLTDVGSTYRAASGWADAMVHELLRARLNAGLPTLVVSEKEPLECGLSKIFIKDSFYVVAFEGA